MTDICSFRPDDTLFHLESQTKPISALLHPTKRPQYQGEAYLSIEDYMMFRQPFDPLLHYLKDPAGAQFLQPIQPL